MCEVDTVFRALANKQRRSAICCLCEHRKVTLADLAEYVAEADGNDVQDISAEQTTEVYFSLYHTHVPNLEEAGLARYDQERDLVVSTEQLKPLVAQACDEMTGLLRV